MPCLRCLRFIKNMKVTNVKAIIYNPAQEGVGQALPPSLWQQWGQGSSQTSASMIPEAQGSWRELSPPLPPGDYSQDLSAWPTVDCSLHGASGRISSFPAPLHQTPEGGSNNPTFPIHSPKALLAGVWPCPRPAAGEAMGK